MDDSPALITLERAWEVIGPERLALLRSCHDVGWSYWQTILTTSQGADMSSTARAQIIHDEAVAQAKRVFPESLWRDMQQLFAIDMGELMTRFKLLDDDLVPRFIPTGQAVLFEEQGQMNGASQMSIWRAVPMLIAGYVLDDFGLSIKRHVLVLRCDGKVIWSRDLPESATGTGPEPISPPLIPAPGPAEVRSNRPEEEERKEAQ